MRSLRAPLGKSLSLALTALSALACSSSPPAETPGVAAPAAEPSAIEEEGPPDAATRARRLVGRMTQEEKLAYIGGHKDFFIRGVERLGIPEIKMADGPVGCRNWGPNTAYPATIALAAAFDPKLTESVGASIARDCRSRGVHVLLAPGVNLQRSPKSGRNFEYLGEDPFLAEEQVVAYIRGVQSGGVVATVKHFALNEQEWDRNRVRSWASPEAERDLYLRPFRAAVMRAQVGAVMTSYNLVDDDFATHSRRLLTQTLRNEWGFTGFIMSDWNATHDAERAFSAGLDLEMPRGEFMNEANLKPLLLQGAISPTDLDRKVERILTTLIQAGFLDREQKIERPSPDPDSREVAYRAARESVVLLKNGKEGAPPLLPLDRSKLRTIAVVGPNAHPAVTGGSGSARVTPSVQVSLLEGITAEFPGVRVLTHPGVTEPSGHQVLGKEAYLGPIRREVFKNPNLEGTPEVVDEVPEIGFTAGENQPAPGIGPENFSLRFQARIRVDQTGDYEVITNADDGTRVFVDGKLLMEDWTAHAPRSQKQKVALTRGEHSVKVEYFQGILGATLSFGVRPLKKQKGLAGQKELVRVLAEADAVVLALGFGQHEKENSMASAYQAFWPEGWAREGGIVEAENDDRPFALPKAQLETLRIARLTEKPTVVIGMAGGGVDPEPWIKHVDALLWAFYPGQEGGRALAEILSGKESPSGKLPFSFAARYEDHPSAKSYDRRFPFSGFPQTFDLACSTESLNMAEFGPGKDRSDDKQRYMTPYCEGVFMGYPGFEKGGKRPLFPFGFGLSYAKFQVAGAQLDTKSGGAALVRVDVKNLSSRSGSEVIQVYGRSSPDRPRRLVGFQKVKLAAGETGRVSIEIRPEALAHFDAKSGTYQVTGTYRLDVATSFLQVIESLDYSPAPLSFRSLPPSTPSAP